MQEKELGSVYFYVTAFYESLNYEIKIYNRIKE